MAIQFYNQLTKRVDEFVSQEVGKVKLYTCGPTVYNYLHVGNWAAYIYWDVLVRTLQANGYDVDRVMNITDVGHLVSDADEGEDKLEKGAKREGKTAWEVAAFYGEDFLRGMKRLNLITPTHITKATEFIPEQLALVRTLKEKGYTYQIDDGIYFDTAKFPAYADFAGLDLDALKAGARVEYNEEKKNPSDFALWKFTPAGEKRDMEWETPIGLLDPTLARVTPGGAAPENALVEGQTFPGADQAAGPATSDLRGNDEVIPNDGSGAKEKPVMGFPGWHLECSAMSMSLLGHTLDIHTGGIDHIPVHHTNEIAQSEAATGQRFSDYWLHNNHLKVNGTKISKSLGNGYTLDDLEEKGFSLEDYRLFILQSHYQHEGNFTFENLTAAKNRLHHWRNVAALRHQIHDTLENNRELKQRDVSVPPYAAARAIVEALNDNLDTPAALTLIDEAFATIVDTDYHMINRDALMELLETIDATLGLKLVESSPDISDDTKQLILERARAREVKDWARADAVRDELAKRNITVNDTPHGSIWEYTEA